MFIGLCDSGFYHSYHLLISSASRKVTRPTTALQILQRSKAKSPEPQPAALTQDHTELSPTSSSHTTTSVTQSTPQSYHESPAIPPISLEQIAMQSSFDYLNTPFRQQDFKWLRENYPDLVSGIVQSVISYLICRFFCT